MDRGSTPQAQQCCIFTLRKLLHSEFLTIGGALLRPMYTRDSRILATCGEFNEMAL